MGEDVHKFKGIGGVELKLATMNRETTKRLRVRVGKKLSCQKLRGLWEADRMWFLRG
jgi:hypothetical protein